LLQRSARKTRYIRAIVERSLRGGASGEQLLAQLDELTRDLDQQSAGEILYQLADHYYHYGQWPSAAESFTALAQRYPDHPLAPLAIRWLLRYYSSGEAGWRVQHDAAGQARRLEHAVAIGRHIERARLDWFLEPEIRFPLAAAYRGLGDTRAADRLYQAQAQGRRDGWWQCAQGELRMSHPAAEPIKRILPCVRARTRPHLDGKLDDAVWREAKLAALTSAQHDDGDWPATVMLAYDDEYLYLAAQCRDPPGSDAAGRVPEIDASKDSLRRPRDGDLSAYDRVEFLLDIDRDFATYYHLAVDRRGWTNDRCWEDRTWDPQWFVATRREAGSWTVEAAVPLKELTGTPPRLHDVWALGVQRVVPGVGFQSWTTPAAGAALPAGFGYLVFE
jgi:hypothetical protein